MAGMLSGGRQDWLMVRELKRKKKGLGCTISFKGIVVTSKTHEALGGSLQPNRNKGRDVSVQTS